MPKRKVIVEVDIHDDKVSSIEDLERDILHQCYGTFRLDFLCPKSILVPINFITFLVNVFTEGAKVVGKPFCLQKGLC